MKRSSSGLITLVTVALPILLVAATVVAIRGQQNRLGSGLLQGVQPTLAVEATGTLETLDADPTLPGYPEPDVLPTQPSPPPPEVATATPESVAAKPPACQYTGSAPGEQSGPSLNAYAFSAPQVVLTQNAAIGIADWLPDSRRLLITRDIAGTNNQTIETFDVLSGELHLYVERAGATGKPIWLEALQAIAYSTVIGQQSELWLSTGDPNQAEMIAQGVEGRSLSASPDGRALVYASLSAGNQSLLWDVTSQTYQSSLPDMSKWTYPKYPEAVEANFAPSAFQVAWRPNSTQLVFYNQPWTFLLDRNSNQICEISLGELGEERAPIWALQAKWSPNGNHLALITTYVYPGELIRSTDLAIVDMVAGQVRRFQVSPEINPGQSHVTDLAWAPDGRYLAMLGVTRIIDGRAEAGLFAVDPTTGQFQQGPSDVVLGGGSSSWQLAWSPDGLRLAANCPTSTQGRVCISPVTSQ